MAQRALRLCNRPGCRTYHRNANGRCDQHASRERTTPTDPFYASPAWRRLRAAFIAANPLCSACEAAGRTELAYIIDHVQERKDRPELELDWGNLTGLCAACHNRKTALARAERKRRG